MRFRKIIITIVLMITFFANCSKKSVTMPPNFETHTYNLSWDVLENEDVTQYNIYWWEGADTLECPFIVGKPPWLYHEYFSQTTFQPMTGSVVTSEKKDIKNGNWARYAVSAINSLGSAGVINVSPFIQKN